VTLLLRALRECVCECVCVHCDTYNSVSGSRYMLRAISSCKVTVSSLHALDGVTTSDLHLQS